MTDTRQFCFHETVCFKVFVVADFAILFEYNKCCYEQLKNALSVCGHQILACRRQVCNRLSSVAWIMGIRYKGHSNPLFYKMLAKSICNSQLQSLFSAILKSN
jgi:hypothetical protein